jgi:predicted NBD/HSP70 family sugar kinase
MANIPGTPRLLRAINDRAALELLLEHGQLSRPQLGAMIGLSKPTASQLLARLEATGLVVQAGLHESKRGPGAQLYAINPRAAYVAGLDVTPQRMDVAIADITGRIVAEHVLVTGRVAPGLVGRVRKAIEGAAGQVGLDLASLRQVVIGTPGAIDPSTGELAYARHLPGWHTPGVVDELRADLGVPLDVENDVNLAAIAELWEGQASASENFVLLWASEGLGLAIVLNGELHRGATGGAGEVGYMPVPGYPLTRNLGRGGHGGFQGTAGASAVVPLARAHGIRARKAADAVERAAADPGAHRAFLDELATRLATGLSAIVAVLDPELIVLTGDIVLAGGETLRRLVEAELHTLALPRPRLVLSSVAGNPVRAGAIHAALTVARDAVFGSTVQAAPAPAAPALAAAPGRRRSSTDKGTGGMR